jgi:hypothetical protein
VVEVGEAGLKTSMTSYQVGGVAQSGEICSLLALFLSAIALSERRLETDLDACNARVEWIAVLRSQVLVFSGCQGSERRRPEEVRNDERGWMTDSEVDGGKHGKRWN